MKKILFILVTILPFIGFSQNPLFIPDTLSGTSINLSLQNGQVEFYPGFNTNTIGYNQDILGKTIILEKGNEVTLNVTNNLSEATTLHWHVCIGMVSMFPQKMMAVLIPSLKLDKPGRRLLLF